MTSTTGLTFIIDHHVPRFTAVMNACVKWEREGKVRYDPEARVHLTSDPEAIAHLRRIGAKLYPA